MTHEPEPDELSQALQRANDRPVSERPWTDAPLGEADCGCGVSSVGDAIQFCATHAAAPEMLRALLVTYAYWRACAKAWSVDGGKVVNVQGKIVAEGEGLDELADHAAPLVFAAIAAATGEEVTP